MTELMFTRIIDGGIYKFGLNRDYSWADNEEITFLNIETPENYFGYCDFVHVKNNIAYTSYRYLPKWIKKRIIDILHKNGLQDFTYNGFIDGHYTYDKTRNRKDRLVKIKY